MMRFAGGNYPTNPATTTTVTHGKNSTPFVVTKDLMQHTTTNQPEVTLEDQIELVESEIACNGSDKGDWVQFQNAILASLLELQRIEAGLREPSEETLGKMMDAWNNEFGSPYTRYAKMLNAALDAILLRRKP